MMKLIKYIIAATLLWSVAACQNEEITSTEGREEIVLSASSLTAVTSDVPQSRATPSVSPFIDKSFKIIMRDNRTSNPHDEVSGTVRTTTIGAVGNVNNGAGVNFGSSVAKQYWDDWGGINGTIKFFGIYPDETAIVEDKIKWNIQTDQSTVENFDASDLMLAYKPTYTFADRRQAADLNFNHLMTKITLNLKKGTGWDSGETFDPAVVIKNVNISGTIDAITPSTAEGSIVKPGDYKISETASVGESGIIPKVYATSSGKTVSAIVVPTLLASKTLVAVITIGSNEYEVKTKEGEVTTFAPGVNNEFEVTINKTGIDVSATVTDWDTAAPVTQEVKIGLVSAGDIIGGTAPSDGSRLYVVLNNQNTYYNKTTDTWTAHSPIYWDNVNFSPNLSAQGLLVQKANSTDVTDGNLNQYPENIFTGNSQALPNAQTSLLFKEMSHPFAKVAVIVRSSTTDSDRVELTDSNITSGLLKDQKSFVSFDSSTLAFSYKDNVSLPGGSFSNQTVDSKTYSVLTYQPVYIEPTTWSGDKELISVVVTNNGISNTYIMKVPAASLTAFAANNEYTLTMTLRKSDVAAQVTVKAWEPNTSITGDGTITE